MMDKSHRSNLTGRQLFLADSKELQYQQLHQVHRVNLVTTLQQFEAYGSPCDELNYLYQNNGGDCSAGGSSYNSVNSPRSATSSPKGLEKKSGLITPMGEVKKDPRCSRVNGGDCSAGGSSYNSVNSPRSATSSPKGLKKKKKSGLITPMGEVKKDPRCSRVCVPCRKTKTGCQNERPCQRCIKMKITDECIDVVHKIPNRQKNNSPVVPEKDRDCSPKTLPASSPTQRTKRPRVKAVLGEEIMNNTSVDGENDDLSQEKLNLEVPILQLPEMILARRNTQSIHSSGVIEYSAKEQSLLLEPNYAAQLDVANTTVPWDYYLNDMTANATINGQKHFSIESLLDQKNDALLDGVLGFDNGAGLSSDLGLTLSFLDSLPIINDQTLPYSISENLIESMNTSMNRKENEVPELDLEIQLSGSTANTPLGSIASSDARSSDEQRTYEGGFSSKREIYTPDSNSNISEVGSKRSHSFDDENNEIKLEEDILCSFVKDNPLSRISETEMNASEYQLAVINHLTSWKDIIIADRESTLIFEMLFMLYLRVYIRRLLKLRPLSIEHLRLRLHALIEGFLSIDKDSVDDACYAGVGKDMKSSSSAESCQFFYLEMSIYCYNQLPIAVSQFSLEDMSFQMRYINYAHTSSFGYSFSEITAKDLCYDFFFQSFHSSDLPKFIPILVGALAAQVEKVQFHGFFKSRNEATFFGSLTIDIKYLDNLPHLATCLIQQPNT